MTDTEDAQGEGKKEECSFLEIDPLLQTVVSLVNETGLGIDVMLSVKGISISGKIIKRDEYYDRLIAIMGNPAAGLRTGTDERIAKMVAEHFSSLLNIFKDLGNKPDESGDKILPTLIHLADVNMINPVTGQPIPLLGALWRGKMDSVDGFIFGKPEIKCI